MFEEIDNKIDGQRILSILINTDWTSLRMAKNGDPLWGDNPERNKKFFLRCLESDNLSEVAREFGISRGRAQHLYLGTVARASHLLSIHYKGMI